MGLIVGLTVFVTGILGTALARQFADEFKAWTPWVIDRLVRKAVARLPENQRERFEEEWRSHINEIPGEIGKFVVALGFVSAARKMSLMLNTGHNRILVGDILKRAVDVTVGAAFLILYAPLLVILSLLIRLESSGPVFYRKVRVGLNGRKFWAYHFRTSSNLHENLKDASRSAPRLTRIGKFLRRTAADQFPLLLNILRGEMSLIGPHPKTPQYVELMTPLIPGYCERAAMKPGLTGWAQVNGPSDPRTELANDLYYIRNRGLKLDVIIILRTMQKVITSSKD
jgi:lipopolysaccharide/colanic/teichoic acid biosynthesis glycosyltransferase